ncbi:hypothetical protein Slin15195_G099540 [Septoria linicola]|uniref:Uncharacterized protein n=1 Tax=Septoria linicola TaxID=215465 RepID=A0A9Q9B1T7_9PEZI|nr:hypothetical protein Slin15195_G099540 [Septoria linicola]
MPCCKYTNRKCYTAPGASNSACTDPQNIVCPAETPVKSPSGDCVASNDDNCGTFGVKVGKVHLQYLHQNGLLQSIL